MPRFRLLRSALTAATAAALVLGPVGSAAAHDVLVSTAPAQDVAVPTAPASVTLMFSDAPQALGTEVTVSGPDGTAVSEDAPQLDGTAVRQPLRDGLPAGRYTVAWRATSADGHPLTGSFGFDVTQGATALEPAGSQAAAPSDTSSNDTSSFPVVWVALAGIAAGAVVLVLRQLRRPA